MKVSAPLIRLITRQELDLDPKELSAQVKLLRTQIDESAEALQAQKLQQLTEVAARNEASTQDNSRERSLELGHCDATV